MTDIQVDMDEIAASLLQYTSYDTQDYLSVNQVGCVVRMPSQYR